MNALHEATIAILLTSFTVISVNSLAEGGKPVVRPHEAIQSLKDKRIFFGHQSVGGEIVNGIEELSRRDAAGTIIVADLKGKALPTAGPGFFHEYLGRNGSPESKNAAFAKIIKDSQGKIDIALFKYCYVDIDAGTDVHTMFEQYRSTLAELKRMFPKVSFVHVTDPLTTVQTGTKAWIKGLLGKPLGEYDANRKRNEYNDYMRKQYMGKEPLFDLAQIEARLPDGKDVTFDYGGKSYSALAPMYTYDGGHLNEEGRRRVAGELIVYLSTLLEKRVVNR